MHDDGKDHAFLLNVHHPGHRDGLREGRDALRAAAIGLLILAVVLGGGVPTSWLVWLGIVVGSAAAGAAAVALVRGANSSRAGRDRADREAETRRRVEEARASGAFARWDDARDGDRAS